MKLSKNVVKYSPLVISSLISYFMDYDTKFIDNLKKPSLYPPGTLFGIVWSILYYNMGIALEKIYSSTLGDKRDKALFLFIIQYVLNLAWSPVFFKNKKFRSAFIIIVALILSVILTLNSFNEIDPTTKRNLVPYLIWLFFAAYLNKYLLDNNGTEFNL